MNLQSPENFKKLNEDNSLETPQEKLQLMIADIIHNKVETREVPYSDNGDGGSLDIEIDYSTIEIAAKEIVEKIQQSPSKSKEEIIAIIKEAWGNNISSSASETALGLESYIDGQDDFYKELEEKL